MSDAPPAVPLDQCVAALADPDPEVRARAVYDVWAHGASGLAALPALLARFRDPVQGCAMPARFAVADLGEAAVPELHRIRREGPGTLRAAALTALADIGGEPALSSRDVAAVERLIRIKLLTEAPAPVAACWLHWIAVPGGDQAGILRILGLTGARPATFALGVDTVDADAHGAGKDEPGSRLGRVFVTPELDGWTLVAGPWCDPCSKERGAEVLRLCLELSAHYGRAQAYYYGAQGDGSAWLVAEDGAVVRRYREAGVGDDCLWTLGEPLAVEVAARAELGLPPTWDNAARDDPDDDTEEEEWRWAAFDLAPAVAAALSIDPHAVGPSTVVRGTPVIALTPEGVAEGVHRGAYRI